jgi:FtsP/CotA-like multicopper oxidase with cupredoxin domain
MSHPQDQSPPLSDTSISGEPAGSPSRRFSRRNLLTAGAGVAAGGLLLSRAGLRLTSAQSAQGAVDTLTEPVVRRSNGGLLDTVLSCAISPVTVGGKAATVSVYEGSYPGPTLHIKPGDLLRVNVVNNLPDDTNLHVHGFHVSPSGHSDDVLLTIVPGENFQYEYQLPSDHPAGYYWYHPHKDGDSDVQVLGGMAGAIVIEGDIDELPGIKGLPERLMILTATQLDPSGRLAAASDRNQNMFMRLVNGQLNPTMTIRPGETQRWRIGNLSADTFFRLSLEGHKLNLIATDGNTLDQVVPVDEVVLAPAERIELLLQGAAAGTYKLVSGVFDQNLIPGNGVTPVVTMATLVSQGEPVAAKPLPTALMPFVDLTNVPIDRQRTVTFQVRPNRTFEVDSKTFDANRLDQLMDLGATEEWVVRNASAVWHPFHIHINPFQVMSINGQKVRAHGYRDTFSVPPQGELVVRSRFLDFTGDYVFHCHILSHEDQGMMQLIAVTDTGAPP